MKVVLFILSAVILHAEPIELTRQQASDLFGALTAIEPGLSVDNIITASDNLMALKAPAESLEKLRTRASRDLDFLPASDDKQQKAWAINEAFFAKRDEVVVVELKRMDLSSDEIKAARITPRLLGPIRAFLAKK